MVSYSNTMVSDFEYLLSTLSKRPNCKFLSETLNSIPYKDFFSLI